MCGGCGGARFGARHLLLLFALCPCTGRVASCAVWLKCLIPELLPAVPHALLLTHSAAMQAGGDSFAVSCGTAGLGRGVPLPVVQSSSSCPGSICESARHPRHRPQLPPPSFSGSILRDAHAARSGAVHGGGAAAGQALSSAGELAGTCILVSQSSSGHLCGGLVGDSSTCSSAVGAGERTQSVDSFGTARAQAPASSPPRETAPRGRKSRPFSRYHRRRRRETAARRFKCHKPPRSFSKRRY